MTVDILIIDCCSAQNVKGNWSGSMVVFLEFDV